MFTGIIDTTGTVTDVRRTGGGLGLAVSIPHAGYGSLAPGASVAVNGVCLTLESRRGTLFYFSAVAETIEHSTFSTVRGGDRVNLERALAVSGRLDGHIVSGHVDGVGRITGDRRRGESIERTVRVPASARPFIAMKGSIALDGISLTVTRCRGDCISVSLVPYTLRNTTMPGKKTGDPVNIECDILARYVHSLLHRDGGSPVPYAPNETADLLERMKVLGF